MTSLAGKYSEAKTCVFWDMEDCPIPNGLNPESVYRNIRTALASKGYRGEVTIWAYGDKNQIPGYFESAGIKLERAGDKYARVETMIRGIWCWLMDNSENGSSNLLVISGDNMDFASSLRDWKAMGDNVLLAEPVNGPRRCCRTVLDALIIDGGAEWLWESLAAAGDL
ncbi:hypothetical protein EUTSA_v10027969mg [Eutrema salsugineum]|uniref:NYN domain-containing protein n=1 Tax=Eutrema salsugineum TaxID=72664 RepID=V4NLE1_EUTSA|nr:uncharacterized protein LOC18022841 [Eutrema salsugineum]ESQ47231.1 hypothetical protein EUTSA_v10027969mg [Eutrema salsugineum]